MVIRATATELELSSTSAELRAVGRAPAALGPGVRPVRGTDERHRCDSGIARTPNRALGRTNRFKLSEVQGSPGPAIAAVRFSQSEAHKDCRSGRKHGLRTALKSRSWPAERPIIDSRSIVPTAPPRVPIESASAQVLHLARPVRR